MLSTSLVALRSLDNSDLPALRSWINDRETVLFNAPWRPISEADHLAWFGSLAGRRDLSIFGITEAATGALVGSCQLHGIHWVHRTAELQIRLAPEARGKGFGTDAVRLLLRHGFHDLNLNRIWLHVLATNAAAIQVYRKVGFAEEGTLRSAAHIDGGYVDLLILAMLRSDHDR
jgi:RimJ/RimL family protein N-acetyltransferase